MPHANEPDAGPAAGGGPRSRQLHAEALRLMPGGVNSPVRSFRSVGGTPVFFTRGEGARLFDADGRAFVDFCGSWGPLILGHAHPKVVAAAAEAASAGLSFGACHPREVEAARLLLDRLPCAEQIRMVNSGTEAVMTAIRLARGATGRPKIIKFDGCYHGHSDSLLVAAGSGLLTGGAASSKGVAEAVARDTLTAVYNDLASVRARLEANPGAVAAVIVEPVAGNMGLVMPGDGFLEGLRRLCDEHGAWLLFDEVITGFRFHAGAYADLCGVRPDLLALGKIIGGGMPVGAVAGPRAHMECLAPLGGVYQAGTLSGNPVALAAGVATVRELVAVNPYDRLSAMARAFADAIGEAAARFRAPVQCAAHGSAFTVFFTARRPLRNLADAMTCDTAAFAAFFHHMLQRGFYLPPAQFETAFLGTAHAEADVEAAAAAACDFIRARYG